jgi:predicted SPOUT superfamily RNA methylase MTH1
MSDSHKKRKRNEESSPSPTKKAKKSPGRLYTVSICVPDSILYNAQTQELRAYLVSQISRAAAIFCIDEIVVYKDAQASKNAHTKHEALGFFTRNLEYLETPQYLRKALFPMHPDLRYSGLLNPLDTPHHLRSDERFEYREGVVVERPSKAGQSWVNVGLKRVRDIQDALVNYAIKPGTRITVKIESYDTKSEIYAELEGSVVSPAEPREQLGVYWGYTTRIANDFDAIFNECPFEVICKEGRV